MILLNLIWALATLNNIQSFENRSNPYPSSFIDSLQIIEKVYLQTDRNCYYPGDDIWFKAYLVNALDRSISGPSRSLHVELISPSSEIIMSRIIRLDGGLGNGDFKLAAILQKKYQNN
jgi:uncharacterized protein YfaS (alpha-2-macroglobulin family)